MTEINKTNTAPEKQNSQTMPRCPFISGFTKQMIPQVGKQVMQPMDTPVIVPCIQQNCMFWAFADKERKTGFCSIAGGFQKQFEISIQMEEIKKTVSKLSECVEDFVNDQYVDDEEENIPIENDVINVKPNN